MIKRMEKIVILHTNDIHSNFESMPKIAKLLGDLRRKHAGTPVITVDCGDHMDRMRMETEGSVGMANIAVMNASGYNIVIPGNNEGLTFSKVSLEHLYGSRCQFSVLGANLKDVGSGEVPDWLVSSVIHTEDSVRIGFIGVTVSYPDFYTLLGWKAEDPFTVLKNEVKKLRERADILVAVSHLGLPGDKRLAEENPELNVILGGHTHHLLETPLNHGNAAICACGKLGTHVGEVELTYDTERNRVVRVEGRCLPTAGVSAEDDIERLIAEYREASRESLSVQAATLHEALEIDWHRESRLANLLAAGIRKWTGAEIAIVNSGQLLQSLLAGPVTKGQLLDLCPSPINPCRFLLKGDRIRLALEQSLLNDYSHKPIFGYGFRGKELGTLAVDGMTVHYDPEGEPYRKISQILLGPTPLQDDAEYDVGSLDMFTFGIGYHSLSEGRNTRYFLPEFIREIVARELQEPEAVKDTLRRRWLPVQQL